ADLLHERRRPAEVCLRITRRLELADERGGEPAGAVEVGPLAIVRTGPAVVQRERERSAARRGAAGPRGRTNGRGRCARRAATRPPALNARPQARGAWRAPGWRRCRR